MDGSGRTTGVLPFSKAEALRKFGRMTFSTSGRNCRQPFRFVLLFAKQTVAAGENPSSLRSSVLSPGIEHYRFSTRSGYFYQA